MTDANVSPYKVIPAGVAIVAVTYGFARYAYGLFLPEMQIELGLSTEVMGYIASCSCLGYLASTLVGSTVSGSYGPRFPIILGGLSAAIGMAVIAASNHQLTLAIGVILAGASPGLAYPPLSDAVMRLVKEHQQSRTYAIINSGTSVGVILSGPAALLAGDEWRLAWICFSIIALVSTFGNAMIMPTGQFVATSNVGVQKIHWRWLLGKKSARLFASAIIFGISSSIYWTFAVDLLVNAGGISPNWSRFFWVIIGACGLAGSCAGDAAKNLGIIKAYRGAVAILAGSILFIGIAPFSLVVAFVSAMSFGSSFILIAGLLGIWSVYIFHERPSAGFGATFFLISAGQLIGPSLAGFMIREGCILASVFIVASSLSLFMIISGPNMMIRGMSRSTNNTKEILKH